MKQAQTTTLPILLGLANFLAAAGVFFQLVFCQGGLGALHVIDNWYMLKERGVVAVNATAFAEFEKVVPELGLPDPWLTVGHAILMNAGNVWCALLVAVGLGWIILCGVLRGVAARQLAAGDPGAARAGVRGAIAVTVVLLAMSVLGGTGCIWRVLWAADHVRPVLLGNYQMLLERRVVAVDDGMLQKFLEDPFAKGRHLHGPVPELLLMPPDDARATAMVSASMIILNGAGLIAVLKGLRGG